MKKFKLLMTAVSIMTVLLFITEAIASRHPPDSKAEVIYTWPNRDPQTCISSHPTNTCYVTTDWAVSLDKDKAENILNTTLPVDAVAVIMTLDQEAADGGWDVLTIGTSTQIDAQYFSGTGPNVEVTYGTLQDEDMYYPEQVVVFSSEYNGYIAYYIPEQP